MSSIAFFRRHGRWRACAVALPLWGRRLAHARAAGLSVSVFSVDVVSNLVNSRKINSNMEWAEREL
jgi:hypothetical protein